MRYEIRAGYARELEVFPDEESFVARWMQVYRNVDAGAWVIEDDGTKLGTFEPGRRRQHHNGVFLNHCIECSKDFWSRAPNEIVCPADLIAVRPAERHIGPEPHMPPRRYSREGMRERLGVSGNYDE